MGMTDTSLMAFMLPGCSLAAMVLRLLTITVVAHLACNVHAIPSFKFLGEAHPAAAAATAITTSGGFRTEFIHRDHFSSPLRKAGGGMDISERVREAVALSHARARGIAAKMAAEMSGEKVATADLVSPLSSNQGSYIMVVQLATPPHTIQALADTGSDLVWVRCKPFKGTGGPVLNFKTSPSYKPIPCVSSQCKALGSNSQCSSSGCGFQYGYGDGSTLAGDFSSDTLTMTGTDGKPQKFTNFSFGCAHTASGNIGNIGGLVGLGRGPVSLPSQLGYIIDRKFSYCLVSFFDAPSKTSPLIFGDTATLQGPGVQTTPIIQNKPVDTYYYLNLQAITVATTTVSIPAQPTSSVAGTIIDSGTTLTYISSSAFAQVLQAFQQATSDLPPVDGSVAGLQYCVDVSGHSNYQFPQLTLHFQNGADLLVPPSNYLLAIFTSNPNVLCFIMDTNDGFPVDLSIIGNLFQQNTQILYDVVNSQLSFAPAQCDSL